MKSTRMPSKWKVDGDEIEEGSIKQENKKGAPA